MVDFVLAHILIGEPLTTSPGYALSEECAAPQGGAQLLRDRETRRGRKA
jgi:hypothetical protein